MHLGTSLYMNPYLSTSLYNMERQYILLLFRDEPTHGSPPIDSWERCPIQKVNTFYCNLGTSLHMDPHLSTAWNAVLSGYKWWVVLPGKINFIVFRSSEKTQKEIFGQMTRPPKLLFLVDWAYLQSWRTLLTVRFIVFLYKLHIDLQCDASRWEQILQRCRLRQC